jgi:hypothetical protein
MSNIIPCLNSINPIIKDPNRQAAYLCMHMLMAASAESTYFDSDRVSLRDILAKNEYKPESVRIELENQMLQIFKKYFTNNELDITVKYSLESERKYKLVITLASALTDPLYPIIGEMFVAIDPSIPTVTGQFDKYKFTL